MKKSFRYSLLLTLGLLIATSLVNAQPVPIGQAEQVRPYESNPTVATKTNIAATFGAERDGTLSTRVSFQGIPASGSGVLYISGFTTPPPAQQFPIGWVDIKIKYKHPGVGDDGYLMGYKTDNGSAVYLWLQTVVSGAAAKFDMNGNPAVRPWVNVTRTGYGAWTWTDIQNLTIRIIVIRGANAVWDSFFDLYEVWVTVYEHAPPSSSTAMSVMPGASNISIVGLPPGKYFFVDVYANGLSGSPGIWGYQATIKYDESVVTATEYFGYWPFITALPSAINPGVVTVCYSSYAGDTVGFTGVATPLCRIYFQVDAGGQTPLDLIDQKPTYVTLLVDALGFSFVPPLYDGWFENVWVYDLTIFRDGSGTTVPAVGVHTYDEGEVVSVTATADPGWIFDHWELDGNNVGATNPISVTMSTDHTLNAVFFYIGPGIPEYPGADISIVAATFGFLAALYFTLKRKKQAPPTAAATSRNLKKIR